jgi:two-component system, OmpR family, sensor histidine kinase TctE
MNETDTTRELVHEMRNELAVARANLEGLVDGKLAPTKERLQGVLQALTQLEGLIEDISGYPVAAGMQSRVTEINVCALLEHEYHSLEPVAKARGVSVAVDRCPVPAQQCVHFHGDPTRIGQIVKNLLINAIRYTPRGGAVSVECARRDGQLEVRVADNGPGIPESERDKVFEPGFRGAAAAGTPGAGFGLSVVKQLVDEHGGTIAVTAAQPQGAVFTVRLPGTMAGLPESCSGCALAQGQPSQ